MKLLVWDTSSKSGAIAALDCPDLDAESRPEWERVRLVNEWSLNVDSQHAERLLWGIHQVLESARWKLADVDVFAVGTGPGSFTGLRIGVTTARTLAHSLGKPLIGVSSLAALARPAALWLSSVKSLRDVCVIAATDAAKGELFFHWGAAKAVAKSSTLPWPKGVQEAVVDPGTWASSLPKTALRNGWVAVGEGRNRYPEAWKKLSPKLRIELPLAFSDQVQGRYLGMLAWDAWLAERSEPALSVYPRYLRASDAEVKLKAGLLKLAP